MTPMGEGVGVEVSRARHLIVPIVLYFLLGVLATVAEPDLQVLAEQVPSIDNPVLIWTVAIGVGIFLVIAAMRIRMAVPLRRLLLVFYFIVFALAALAPANFIPVSFDSGGVTTGPITVPVSYTHLDVYKRQLHIFRSFPDLILPYVLLLNFFSIQSILYLTRFINIIFVRYSIPVSYTHLLGPDPDSGQVRPTDRSPGGSHQRPCEAGSV